MASNDFTIDKREYQSVFKVFDKDNTGEITIQQVNHYIAKFESIQANPSDFDKSRAMAGGSDRHRSSNDPGGGIGLHSHNKGGASAGGGKFGPGGTRQLQHGASLGPSGGPSLLNNGLSNGNGSQGKAGTKLSNTTGGKYGGSPNKRISAGGPSTGAGPQLSTQQQQQQQHQYPRQTSLQLKATQLESQSLKQQTQPMSSSGNGATTASQAQNGKGQGQGQTSSAASGKGRKDGGDGNAMNFMQGSSGQANCNNKELPLGSQHHSSSNSEDAGAFNTTNHTQTAATAGSSTQTQSHTQPQTQQQTNTSSGGPGGSASVPMFPNGKQSLQFEEFIDVIRESCVDSDLAENYLVYAFSMFDREKKGYINSEDLKVIFSVLNENVTDEELNTMIKIAGVKSNDKINFKEFVDFFYKVD